MDPVSALIFAAIVTHVIMRAAAQAGADQARAEARRAADAVRRDLQARRTAAAGRLRQRLDAGRAAGPVYPLWWAWAAVRTAGAIRRTFRQRRRPAERPGRSTTTGPLSRILAAAWRGGAYAWEESRRQRRGSQDMPRPGPQSRPQPARIGVCERCGAAAAVTALAEALTRHGRKARMCAQCRADTGAQRRADASGSEGQAAPAGPAADVVDADVVDAELVVSDKPRPGTRPVGCTRCGEPLVGFRCANPDCLLCPAHVAAPGGAPEIADPARWKLPVRYCPECRTQLLPDTWYAVSATNADVCLFCAYGSGGQPGSHPDGACRKRADVELAALGTPADDQGRPVTISPQHWAQLAAEAARIAVAAASAAPDDSRPDTPAGMPRQAAAPAALPAPAPTGDAMSCNGEVHTQADWAAQSAAITEQLDVITESSENMLRCLTAREASRSQMTAAAAWADQVAAVASRGREIVAGVNAHQDPYVDAVQSACGSAEVAVPGYYDEM